MIRSSSPRRDMLLIAGALLVGTFLTAFPLAAAAQGRPDPGSPLFGQPDSAEAKRLAPVPAPPLPTPADKLPVAKLKLPPGFKHEVYASGIANARSLREGDKGT